MYNILCIWNKEDSKRYERGVQQRHGKKSQTEILEIKSSLNQIKNAVESPSNRLEQVEDGFWGLNTK
jgi:primosomal protein N''